MKKKMLTAAVIFITLFLFTTAGWYLMYIYLGWGSMPPFLKIRRVEQDPVSEFMAEDASLMAVVESEEEAMEIAEEYMIELVSFENGMALFQTEEDPYAVIRRGEENGYPPLSVNYVRTIDGVTEE